MHLRFAAAFCCTALALAASAAQAEGGRDIQSAPPVPFEQQQAGNLSNGALTKNSCDENVYDVWWLLPVITGDKVTIDWEAQYTEGTQLSVFPTGTTDFTYPQVDPVVTSTLNDNAKAETTVQASNSGSMPVQFTSNRWSCLKEPAGSYAFTAYVKHALLLAVPRRPTMPRTGVVKVSVRTPDGDPIGDSGVSVALRLRIGGKLRVIGHGTPVAGVATVSYRVPASLRRQRGSLTAQATGANYLTKTSAGQRVRIS